jgi:arginase family enzyme
MARIQSRVAELLGRNLLKADRIVGADLVEYNPRQDPSGRTAMVAAKLMKERMGRMLV